jgi:hypothetical protein
MPNRHTPSHRLLLRLLVAAQVLYVLGVAGAGYATTAYGQHVEPAVRKLCAPALYGGRGAAHGLARG